MGSHHTSGGRRRAPRRAVTTLLGVGLVLATAVPAGAADGIGRTVADGLAGPLGLAVSADGTVFVAEGFRGALTSIDRRGNRATVYEGPIFGVDAGGRGDVVVTGADERDATLSAVRPHGRATTTASLADHEESTNPDGDVTYGFVDVDEACAAELAAIVPFLAPYPGIVESNPYAVLTVPGGHVVADAAGNSLVEVGRDGRTSTLAVLPPVRMTVTQEIADELSAILSEGLGEEVTLPTCAVGTDHLAEPVPTDVERGPDGAYYVTTLPGFPELPGTASVWRVDPADGTTTEVIGGLTGAVDLAVAKDGTIYVAELFASRISVIRDGAVVREIAAPTPGAVEVARDGTVYATIGVFGPGGSVVELRR